MARTLPILSIMAMGTAIVYTQTELELPSCNAVDPVKLKLPLHYLETDCQNPAIRTTKH
jgi:hypothetical protein